VYEGGQFSYPDQEAYNAAQQMIKLLSGRKATDLVIVLISGKCQYFMAKDYATVFQGCE
jgi:glycerate-2-kinase